MEPQSNLQKNIGILLGIIVLLGVLFVTIFLGKQANVPVIGQSSPNNYNSGTNLQTSPTPTSSVSPKTPTNTPPAAKTIPSYTLAQVATHSNSSSCWSIIGTSVYDLTSWINSHPGGSRAILSICGKDGTVAFENQHGGQKRPENELKSFFIGNYKK